MKKKVKEPTLTLAAIDKLHKMVEQMEYYYKNTKGWKEFIKDASYIEDHILELCNEKFKEHKRINEKYIENEVLKEEIKELKEELEELKDAGQTVKPKKHK